MTTSPTNSNPDPLLTVADAAEYLGISERSVYRALHAKGTDRLPSVRLGPQLVRVRLSALEAFISSRETQR